MKKFAWTLTAFAVALLLQSYTTPAHAQVARTWVSATGNDNNYSAGCPATAPCGTFGVALNTTTQGGEIYCLGPAEGNPESTVTITYAVTIDCRGTIGAHATYSANGFVINAPGAVVTLRGLIVDGFVGYNNGSSAGLNGVLIQAAAVVNIEDCVIENYSQAGISDTRTGGGTRLFIKNTVVRNNSGAGIVAAAAAVNSAVLENVQSVGNKYGIAVASGNHVVVSRSVMSQNTTAGIEADPGAQVSVDNTEITHNIVVGVQAYGTVTLANSDISYNSAAISGATTSYGNNRIFGNPESSTTPTPIGGASTDFGQL